MKIEDYAFLSDTQTGALVGHDGSVDWLCFPRFDSGACFAALLGDEKNGCWRFLPADEIKTTRRRYRGDTLILETDLATATGVDARVEAHHGKGTRTFLGELFAHATSGGRGAVRLRDLYEQAVDRGVGARDRRA